MDTITADQFAASEGTSDWAVVDGMATARFATGDFDSGARLVAAIAEVADAANHHPDVDLRYPSVTVRVVTHSAGGLTHKDVALARAVSAAASDLGVDAAADEG